MMIPANNLMRAFITSTAFIVASCETTNKTKDTDAVQKLQSGAATRDSALVSPNDPVGARLNKPSRSNVPPSFGEPPRHRGSINPINPAGPGASGY